MNLETKKVYSELYQILIFLGDEYINKLPKSLYNILKEERDTNYNPIYRSDKPLHEQNIDKKTISILALLHLNYWCNDEKEKQELKEILKNNEIKYQKEIRNKYNLNDIFKRNNPKDKIEENSIKSEIALINYRETFFRRLMTRIKKFFKIN